MAYCLLKFGVLGAIDNSGKCTRAELEQRCEFDKYALGVLLDMALSMGLIWQMRRLTSMRTPITRAWPYVAALYKQILA
ncbi:MAG: MarR family transcriptional regulator [Shewanella sp.]